MRTTLDIAPDVLQAAREIAKAQGSTVGRVISLLSRSALAPSAESQAPSLRNGVPLLPRRPGEVVTSEQVRKLEDLD